MKTKKLVSLGLAAVMSLSLTAPAFAADPTATNMETEFTATYSLPDINVVVPQTGTVALNPLGLDVELDPDDTTGAQTIKGLQIVTTPTTIVNNSKMKLDVNATITTTLDGALKLTASEQALVGTPDKEATAADYIAPKIDTSAFVFFEMKASAKSGSSIDDADINKEAASWAYDYTETIGTDSEGNTTVTPKDGCLILATSSGKSVSSSKALVTLAAGDGTESKAGGVAQMRICGKMVQSPKTAWAETDKLTAQVAFTFTPNTTP